MSVDIAALVETPDFRGAEDSSWLRTSCDTSLIDGVQEHYDQVVGMSQGMINYTLKRMHQLNPELNTFDGENRECNSSCRIPRSCPYPQLAYFCRWPSYSNSHSLALGTGLISAELKAPEILVDTVDRNVVTWRTNFDTGTLVFTAENGDRVTHPIDGWSIDVQVPLGKLFRYDDIKSLFAG